MAAAKPNENEECDEDETDTNMAAKARSVTVKGLSSGTTSNDVMIYFQKKKNGGGEVEDVKLNEKEGTAIVIFDEPKVAENVLLKQHKIKDVNITVESLIKVFARVTANVDSEALGLNDEEIGHLLEKIRRETNIEFHFASFAYLMSGTFEQIAASRQHLQKEQLKRPRQKIPVKKEEEVHQQSTASFERWHGKTKPQDPQEESITSGSAVDQFQKSTDEKEDEGYQTTDNFMKMFQKVYKEQLEKMEKDYKVDISQYSDPKGEMKVKVKPKDKCTDPHLHQAREEFITLFQTAHQNAKLVRFSTRDKSEANCSKLRRVIQNFKKELPVVIDRADDRVSYQIYGERDTVEQALRELRDTVDIKTDESQVYGAGSSTGQSSSRLDVEEAMDVDDDELDTYEHYYGAVKISVLKGDITDQRVDAIVNAANENLDHGGGVAGAIVDKGGYGIQDESDRIVRRYGKVEVGGVVVTEAGHLPCKKIIHAVGPRWYAEGEKRSRQLLRDACINSLITAEDLKLTSIAFPAISSGIFGMPKETSAEVMFAAVEEYGNRSSKPVVTDVRVVIIDNPTVEVFRQEFEFRYEGIDDNTQEQDKSRDMKSKREPTMNKARRHSKELYTPPRTKTGQLNRGEKSDEDAAVESTGGSVSGKEEKRSLRGKKAQNKAFTQEKVLDHPLDGDDRNYNSPPSYSAAVKGNSSSPSSIKDQNSQWKTQKGKKNHDVAEKPNDVKCPVCLDQLEIPKTLSKCGHVFCTTCIDEAFKRSKTCPVCKEVYGITRGNQPRGQMNSYSSYYRVPGYEKYGSIQIVYYFQSGKQGWDHPSPGQGYSGTSREAYLPDCPEGREVLRLLTKAFDAGLVFTIGRSATTGQDNQIVWNDIHHKTSYTGGPIQ